MENFELSVVWWNTSLSPPISSKRDKSSDEKRASIASVIQKFMENDYEFICLGEVGPEDIDFFEKTIFPQTLGYFCAKGIDGVGRTFFDTCIYYKKYHYLIRNGNSDVQNFTMTSATRTFKYGQKYKFCLLNEEKITIYLSHWPSKLNDVSLQIESIAERLRVNIEDELNETKNIILVGDYNVEPYDPAVVHQLQSSREKTIVSKKPNVFYNPCWKFLVPSVRPKTLNTHGTYYYANGQFHNWHVIDQIMFSSNFLSDEWDLQDKYINIVNLTNLDDTQKSLLSDHHPLSAVILRK
ncbi:endonuclease/exonuclease/phosphatase family protein [Acinetobacter pittii]|uniref:endonuclease/exonuclease/phosphatase family protein n=1 Tax=Acinetobacter pittii TaxID=48296 RepID=UPI003B4365DC